jgi:hypothetical protein
VSRAVSPVLVRFQIDGLQDRAELGVVQRVYMQSLSNEGLVSHLPVLANAMILWNLVVEHVGKERHAAMAVGHCARRAETIKYSVWAKELSIQRRGITLIRYTKIKKTFVRSRREANVLKRNEELGTVGWGVILNIVGPTQSYLPIRKPVLQ